LSDRAIGGERYDAVDPEEMGAEWLQRALDAEGPGKPHE
jgi:hypothetical protein